MRGPIDSKPDTCTEPVDVYAAGISGKVVRITLGGLPVLPLATGFARRREGAAEVSRGHSRLLTGN